MKWYVYLMIGMIIMVTNVNALTIGEKVLFVKNDSAFYFNNATVIFPNTFDLNINSTHINIFTTGLDSVRADEINNVTGNIISNLCLASPNCLFGQAPVKQHIFINHSFFVFVEEAINQFIFGSQGLCDVNRPDLLQFGVGGSG